MPKSLAIIAHNIRSSHNIGSLIRTAEGLGVYKVYLTGYTPYPASRNDNRLPHIAHKTDRQISKTSLGAEKSLNWEYQEDVQGIISGLKQRKYLLAGLEQAEKSQNLPDFKPPEKMALLLGNEVTGIEDEIMNQLDIILEIPMSGQKESYNVVEAASIAMYHCIYGNQHLS